MKFWDNNKTDFIQSAIAIEVLRPVLCQIICALRQVNRLMILDCVACVINLTKVQNKGPLLWLMIY